MPALFNLHIRAADRDFFEGECTSLTLPVSDGQLGILAFHVPMVAAVVPGTLTCRLKTGETLRAVVGHGIVRFSNNDAMVLLESVEHPEDIDAERAERAAEAAGDALRQSQTPQEKLQAQGDLKRARMRLREARRGKA